MSKWAIAGEIAFSLFLTIMSIYLFFALGQEMLLSARAF